jgi:hypothetical protein
LFTLRSLPGDLLSPPAAPLFKNFTDFTNSTASFSQAGRLSSGREAQLLKALVVHGKSFAEKDASLSPPVIPKQFHLKDKEKDVNKKVKKKPTFLTALN